MDLQSLLQQKIEVDAGQMESVREYMHQYYKLYGFDDFFSAHYRLIAEWEPSVLLLCLDCESKDIEQFVCGQVYHNINVMPIDSAMDLREIKDEASNFSGEYVAFWEPDNQYTPIRLADSIMSLITSPDDMVISYRNFLTEGDCELKDDSIHYTGILKNKSFKGAQLLSICIDSVKNLYGNLSTIVVKKIIVDKTISEGDAAIYLSNGRNKTLFLHNMMRNSKIHFLNKAHVLTRLKKSKNKKVQQQGGFEKKVVVKESCTFGQITFFYTDKSEYYNVLPIAEKAEKRGYKTIFTTNIHQKAEIGIYCQHVCYPENSRFSVILLHDMTQGHDRWPNIWQLEQWDKFDVGILPGAEWAKRWAECASLSYVRPRFGAYILGHPKGDYLVSRDIVDKANAFRSKLRYPFTVLYATSWENDNKEDDFVQALHELPINMFIKQCPTQDSSEYPFQLHRDCVDAMYRLHSGKYENLTYVDVSENILVPLYLCDLVVSDESSVMIEAALYSKPSIAVTDWLIPDTIPHRFASVPIESVYKCKKNELRDAVERMITNKGVYEEYRHLGEKFFSNKGHCCDDILDLIENIINGEDIEESLKKKRVFPKYELISLYN